MKVLLTGSRGMLGSAILKVIPSSYDVEKPTRAELNLLSPQDVTSFIANSKPDVIIHVAAKVGGIQANIDNPFEFLTENLRIDLNVLTTAQASAIPRLFYIGSTCMYPKDQTGPLVEKDILTGILEPTNEGYALAKIIGSKIVEIVATKENLNWRVLIPSNLYGPGDNFNPNGSHLVAAIIRKVDNAIKTNSPMIDMWGDGESRREFTFVDDVAQFICDSLTNMELLPIKMNIGTSVDYSVREYYEKISKLMGYQGLINADLNKPNGMRRKLSDSSLALRHGWDPKTDLDAGLSKTIAWYRENE